MKQIHNRNDVKELVDGFYRKVLEDAMLGPIFRETFDFKRDEHMTRMYDFWDSVLFGTALYRGNPILKHIELNKKKKLDDDLFDRWIELWELNIDENFQGAIAGLAKDKAVMMKQLMQHKIKASNDQNFIQ